MQKDVISDDTEDVGLYQSTIGRSPLAPLLISFIAKENWYCIDLCLISLFANMSIMDCLHAQIKWHGQRHLPTVFFVA